VVSAHGSEKSMQRVLKYDGLVPSAIREGKEGKRDAEQANPTR
jgi:hypothetical protein